MKGLKQRVQIASGSQVAQSAELGSVARCRRLCEASSRVFRPSVVGKLSPTFTKEGFQHLSAFRRFRFFARSAGCRARLVVQPAHSVRMRSEVYQRPLASYRTRERNNVGLNIGGLWKINIIIITLIIHLSDLLLDCNVQFMACLYTCSPICKREEGHTSDCVLPLREESLKCI